MSQNSPLPVIVIACKVFEKLIEKFFPTEWVKKIVYLDYGLHIVPRKLRLAIQEQIDGIAESSLIVLGYGLCGNGLHGIKAGKNILLIPRTDDCIAILFGSYARYREQFDETPGTYYLTKGWLESGSNPLDEYQQYVARYGERQATWLMDQQYHHYVRLAFIAQQVSDLEEYRAKALEIARYCQRWNMRYEEILGSDEYIKKLFQVAMALDQAGDDFIVVPPGGVLEQMQFIRTKVNV